MGQCGIPADLLAGLFSVRVMALPARSGTIELIDARFRCRVVCRTPTSRELGRPGLSIRLKPARITTPLLVLGAENDKLVVNGDVRATARAYRVQAEFFPGGHNMMLEPGWPDVAECIHSWLTSQGI
jgi:pimeloyl-ACP methyl ester carboxylesterase